MNVPDWMQKQVSATDDGPEWLGALRCEHSDAFKKCGLPTRKEERWKYTDINFLNNQNFSRCSLS